MGEELQRFLGDVCHELFQFRVSFNLTRPDEQFGDYATNMALLVAQKVSQNPRDVGAQVVEYIKHHTPNNIIDISLAGPGFINFTVSDEALINAASLATTVKPQPLKGQSVVIDFASANPFKILHAGHLYTSIVGDIIANLYEIAGATVHRINFGGDVGLHVGKSMYAICKKLNGENPDGLNAVLPRDRSNWLAECYVEGSKAYDEDPKARQEIIGINKRVYELHATNDHTSPFAVIYWTCRKWSYQDFDVFYEQLGTKFEKYYPESSVSDLGEKTVREQLKKGVFKESDGAIIFEGEQYGLHTRVFITANGLPTYEAKDVGLIMTKWHDYKFDKSIVITGNEQEQYMAVVLKAIEQFAPDLSAASVHITHGIVKLVGGIKMSSRLGNILKANDVIQSARDANKLLTGADNESTVLAAVKYAFLKLRIGGDIMYDPKESVSLLGNSGPYLQYAHARASSILHKSTLKGQATQHTLEKNERSIIRKIGEYPEIIAKAIDELAPHIVCTYLYELAQVFNSFYEHNRVIDDPREDLRLEIVRNYSAVLRDGLTLLSIDAPLSM
ncbi:MAG: arginine--tRNA ligase [Candidatus Saccharimonadales bacterium]